MTKNSEKARIYQWLLGNLASGVKLTQRFETHAAAQEVEKELREQLARNVCADHGMAVNFATNATAETAEAGT